MNWIECCPECGGIDYRGTVRHIACYLFSARYRRARRKATVMALVFDRLINKSSIQGGDTIHIPRIDRLTADDLSKGA